MKDQGCIQPNIAFVGEARPHAEGCDGAGHIGLGDPAHAVRSRRDQQWRVVRRHRVQVDPQRHHPLQDGGGQRDVQQAGLARPRTKAGHIPPGQHGDSAVLVPGQGPVRAGGLVEQHRPDSPAVRPQHGGRDLPHVTAARQHRAQRRDPVQPHAGLPIRHAREGCLDLLHGGAPALVVAVALVWGVAVIADSAQFSAAVAELADPASVGTLLTLQTCLGFALTLASIGLVPVVVGWGGWTGAFTMLAAGPLLGAAAMLRLRGDPEAVRLAGGRG